MTSTNLQIYANHGVFKILPPKLPLFSQKPRQRKNSLPAETSKKLKIEATTCQNKFSVLSIEDPPEELQIDEPLPPSPTPEKTTTKPKKKHGPSKKPASLANKQPPAPTPVITAAQIAQPSTSTATPSIRNHSKSIDVA
ncbi:hypothetical protein NPIL_48981 [Nephila pilipes]|uniref:Uncharacterized protein n=1 Tax=Nephila pilipes TaxID=299642 RepID=A0A8X6Q883_NEPPI|nr:hypothetical protein NPIL_48981 [Nephila pilipes]